jgi:energy-coupling factor transporter ATP-binding protein EcfA2
MLNANYAFLVESLYNKMKVMLSEYRAFDPRITNTEKGKALLENLKKIHNKLAFIALTNDKQLLTITGEQGSGKTTLLNRLYELELGYLPENDSRGEQLPVLITEKEGLTEPECYVVKLEEKGEHFEIVKHQIDKDKFFLTSLHPKGDIWLELFVPYKLLKSENKSIILLPGFERDKGQLSQQLLDHILYMSTSSLVVFSKDTFARESSANIIRKVKRVFKDVDPIYVLSFGDVNQEENEGIKQQVMEEFAVKSKQVVVTGDPKEFKEPWKQQLLESINQFGFVTEEIDEKKNEALLGITEEISDAMMELTERLDQYEIGSLTKSMLKDRNDRKLLTKFQSLYEKHITEVKKEIITTLRQRSVPARESFDSYVSENVNLLENIKGFFVSSEFEKSLKFEQKIEEVWHAASDQSPTEEMASVLTNCMEAVEQKVEQSAERLKMRELKAPDSNETDQEGSSHLAVNVEGSQGELSKTVQKSLETIDKFFGANPSNQLVTLDEPELNSLVLIGSMLGRQSFVISEIIEAAAQFDSNRVGIGDANREKLEQQIEKSKNELENMQKKLDLTSSKTKMILSSIPVILGVDVAIDGDFDLLTGAVSALSQVGISITPGALLSVIGIGLVGAKVVEIIHRQALQNNERKIQMANAGRRIINELPELQAEAFCNVLRNIYEKIEERIREQHEWKRLELGYDQDLMKLQYQANSILKSNKQLIKEVMKHGQRFAY